MKFRLRAKGVGGPIRGNFLVLHHSEKSGSFLAIRHIPEGEESEGWEFITEFSEEDIKQLPKWCQHLTRERVDQNLNNEVDWDLEWK